MLSTSISATWPVSSTSRSTCSVNFCGCFSKYLNKRFNVDCPAVSSTSAELNPIYQHAKCFKKAVWHPALHCAYGPPAENNSPTPYITPVDLRTPCLFSKNRPTPYITPVDLRTSSLFSKNRPGIRSYRQKLQNSMQKQTRLGKRESPIRSLQVRQPCKIALKSPNQGKQKS